MFWKRFGFVILKKSIHLHTIAFTIRKNTDMISSVDLTQRYMQHMNSVIAFLKQRRSVMIRSLNPLPLPENDLSSILECGTRVPDHGMLTPWQIIVITGEQRHLLGRSCLRPEFARINPDATDAMLKFEESRFEKASAILCVVSKPVIHPKIPEWEMYLSAGAVCQNLLTASLALGYGAQWVTHWYSYNNKMIAKLGGNPDTDKIAGFIYIGAKTKQPKERNRPEISKVALRFGQDVGVSQELK